MSRRTAITRLVLLPLLLLLLTPIDYGRPAKAGAGPITRDDFSRSRHHYCQRPNHFSGRALYRPGGADDVRPAGE